MLLKGREGECRAEGIVARATHGRGPRSSRIDTRVKEGPIIYCLYDVEVECAIYGLRRDTSKNRHPARVMAPFLGGPFSRPAGSRPRQLPDKRQLMAASQRLLSNRSDLVSSLA